jgi:hypothetical protein
MNNIHLVYLLISSSILYSQNIKPSLHAVKFGDDSLNLNFSHFEVNKITFDYSKPKTPFSLYNPMPGLNAFKINSRHYYSMDNTNRLLCNEMKSYEKEPIFPDVKKISLCEAVFSQVMNSIFDK